MGEGKRASEQREKNLRERGGQSVYIVAIIAIVNALPLLDHPSSYRQKARKQGSAVIIALHNPSTCPLHNLLFADMCVCTQLTRLALSVLTLFFHSCIYQPRKERRTMPLPACVSPMHSCDGCCDGSSCTDKTQTSCSF
ncbi:MAG: hypothetical protein JOS17DRAFT_594361 [Linnemannia elongata]|nr:MAG: hypothetical protein JOS17DRAFT_594361 [Linnemannia elongata]